jgi:membrane-associated phospholipid phosphatase
MSEAQDALRAAIDHWMAANGPAESALFGLIVAGVLVAAGFTYRLPPWRSAAVRGAGLVLAIAVLGVQVRSGGWVATVDHSLTVWVVGHRNPTADHIAMAVTSAFGPAETVGGAVMAAVVVWLASRSWPVALKVIVVVGGASFICWLLKLLVARARPPLTLQETLETDYSFPSGHVAGTAALVGIIAVVIGLGRGRTFQILLSAIAALVVCAVGVSRVYLGVHWMTDVVAGALLGALAVTIGATTLRPLTVDSPRELESVASVDEARV